MVAPHPIYNRTNYPIFLMQLGPWALHGNGKGSVASISLTGERKSSLFGSEDYFRSYVWDYASPDQSMTLSRTGLDIRDLRSRRNPALA